MGSSNIGSSTSSRTGTTTINKHLAIECYIVGVDMSKYFGSLDTDYICDALYAEVKLNKSLSDKQARKIGKIL